MVFGRGPAMVLGLVSNRRRFSEPATLQPIDWSVNQFRDYPAGGVPLGRLGTKRGTRGAGSAWWCHVGSATGAHPRRVPGRIQGCDPLPG